MRFSQDGTHLVDQIIANPENVFTWATKPDASEYTGSAWFSDIGAMGYSDGDDWYKSVRKESSYKKTSGKILHELANGTADLAASSTVGAGAVRTTSDEFGGRGVKIVQNTGVAVVSNVDIDVPPFLLGATDVIVWLLKYKGRYNTLAATLITTQASNFAGYCSYSDVTPYLSSIDLDDKQSCLYITGALLDAHRAGDLSIGVGSTIDKVRLKVTLTAGSEVTLLGCYLNPMSKAAIPLCWDDGYDSVWQEVFPYMAEKNLKGSIAINTDNIETSDRLTVPHMDEMYEYGWDILNHSHTHSHINFGVGASNGNYGGCNQIATLQTVLANGFLTLNGSIGATTFDTPRCLVFYFAGNESNKRMVITGVDEDGVATVQTISGYTAGYHCLSETVWTKVDSIQFLDNSTGNIAVGVSMSYAEILAEVAPPKAYLLARGYTRGSDIYIAPFGESSVLLERVIRDQGYKFMRLTRANINYPHLCAHCMSMPSYGNGITSGGSATLTTYMDKVVAHRGTLGIYLHDTVADSATPNSSQARIADTRLVIDKAAALRDAGTCDFPTYSEYVSLSFPGV